ncbi:EFR1 family ferrodoxin [Mobilitalea sibirica]|uniref:Ferredoxin n=1 Tax=Mobilitalea sibirica TaxID=1462919 RepID=A0A8J7L349_9FIRM|nr:EFR1 family ferrodoxin [Mobilitalea sibirica]MBH1941813.1 EFR1 family ferrodoxin [Mobilitalea sibirica]
MKKIIIYYFSGTGNTWWIANALYLQLKGLKHPVECYSIEKLSTEDVIKQVNEAEHIVLGFPVYGSTAPRPMLDFIQQFPNATNNQLISIFATHAMASGDSAYYIGSFFTRKGYELNQTEHFVMMNNFHLPKFRFYKPKNDYRLDLRLQKVLPKVERLAEEISNNQKHIIGNNLFGHLLGGLQRKHIDKTINKLGNEFKVDSKQCIKCGRCERICPTHNISMRQGTYQFGNKCALCLRCYSQCPVSAILIGEGTKNKTKYPRYKGPGEDFNINILIENIK